MLTDMTSSVALTNDDTAKRIRRFFLISHSLPLITTLIVMLISQSVIITNPLLGNLLYIGFISPTVAALYIVYRFYNKAQRKDYWHRIVDIRRITWQWGLFIVLFPFCIRLLASLADGALHPGAFTFHISPSMTVGYALLLLPFGPIPEEVGWRGVVLPDLQKRFGFVRAVVILGVMWCIWHLPMFFVEGTYHNSMGFFTPLFYNYFLQAFFTSIILAVVYFKTNRSILAVILLHYFGNLMGETLAMSDHALIVETVIRGVVAVCMLIVFTRWIDKQYTPRQKEGQQ